jgi:hypothetical protein
MLHRIPRLAGLLAIATLSLAGCQSTKTGSQPQHMSNIPERSTNEPTVTPDMERFDSGIGDTATGTGGGMSLP